MKRMLRTFWTRSSLLGVVLMPTLLVVGAGSSGSALVSPDAAVAVPHSGLAVARGKARQRVLGVVDVSIPAIDPLLGAQPYLSAMPFGATIASVGARYAVDPLLIASVVEAESSFRVDAVSPKGALGLMQVMPVHIESGIEPLDPEVNLELGAALLADLSVRFDGRLDLALAAYHAGPGAVDRYRGVPPYTSTQRYVARVLEIYLEHYAQLTGENRG